MMRFLFIITCVLWLASPAWGGELRVYTEVTGDSAIYQDGKLTGGAVEVVREVMRRIGLESDIQVIPWARSYDALLHDPDVVLFSTALTEERQDLFQWVGPILRADWVLLARKGEGHLISSLEDAKRVSKIGTYISDVRDKYLVELGFTNLERCTDMVINYRKLARGRLDLVAAADLGMDWVSEEAGLEAGELEIALSFYQIDAYIAFSKKTDAAIVELWRDALDSMKTDGTFQRIYGEWFPGKTPPLK